MKWCVVTCIRFVVGSLLLHARRRRSRRLGPAADRPPPAKIWRKKNSQCWRGGPGWASAPFAPRVAARGGREAEMGLGAPTVWCSSRPTCCRAQGREKSPRMRGWERLPTVLCAFFSEKTVTVARPGMLQLYQPGEHHASSIWCHERETYNETYNETAAYERVQWAAASYCCGTLGDGCAEWTCPTCSGEVAS